MMVSAAAAFTAPAVWALVPAYHVALHDCTRCRRCMAHVLQVFASTTRVVVHTQIEFDGAVAETPYRGLHAAVHVSLA